MASLLQSPELLSSPNPYLEAVKQTIHDVGPTGITIDMVVDTVEFPPQVASSKPMVGKKLGSKFAALIDAGASSLENAQTVLDRAFAFNHAEPRIRFVAIAAAMEMMARFHVGDFTIIQDRGFHMMRQVLECSRKKKIEEELEGFAQLAKDYDLFFAKLERFVGDLLKKSLGSKLEADELVPLNTLAEQLIRLVFDQFNHVTQPGFPDRLPPSLDQWSYANRTTDRFLDGLKWLPLSIDHDYASERDQILHDAFHGYWLELQKADLERKYAAELQKRKQQARRRKKPDSDS